MCDADQCEIKSDDLNMHSTLVFGESFSFYFGGMDPSVTLVDLKMTGSAGSLKVIFYDIVKAHIERKGNKIAGKGLVLDTQLNLESTIGKTLFVSANGPTGKCHNKTGPEIFQSPFDFFKSRRPKHRTLALSKL